MIEHSAKALQTVPYEWRQLVHRERFRIDPGAECARMVRVGALSDGLLCVISPVAFRSLDLLQVVLCP